MLWQIQCDFYRTKQHVVDGQPRRITFIDPRSLVQGGCEWGPLGEGWTVMCTILHQYTQIHTSLHKLSSFYIIRN